MTQEAGAEQAAIPHGGAIVDADLPRRYLTLAANVADRLLGAADPAAMIEELFDLIRSELRLDVFFNYRFDGDRLVLEVHGGLTPAQAEAGAVLEVGQAVCGCVARDRTRVHATAVQASDDPLVAFVKHVGLDAYACTPLIHGSELLGTLGFGRRWVDRFNDDELSFLHTICHYVALAKFRLRVEEELRRGVAERERLLAELNHRVRNSLQMAVGVVAVEARSAGDAAVREALQRAVTRLEVLAVAHRPLYAGSSVGGIDALEVLGGAAEGEAEIIGEAGWLLPVECAVALALLVRALLTQPGKAPPVLRVARGNEGHNVTLEGPDWGRNDMAEADRRMVTMLSRQLRAEVTFVADAMVHIRIADADG
ncbi:GAF domain-containing protein [Sphingomonas psychrotolerans]|uniref:GAF domain-containing protein n=1 Tax=Sphingomonas psychrotolerans TaxID=1327635 RepID=A0ABU3N344_9SPHN|nr:GAF domain-containing protein [Sphingomonas psychrotolerans]MDT8758902.1 GAF domain-containing protein [Sphingomonas psychrotolerans]